MRHQNQRGFTLIEVLVSMVIFSIGILGVINMQVLSTVTNVQARGMTEGVIVAQNKVEELLAKSYTSPDLNAGAHSDTTTNSRYSTSWIVDVDTPFPDTKTVHMTVNWNQKGITQGFSMDAVKTKEFN